MGFKWQGVGGGMGIFTFEQTRKSRAQNQWQAVCPLAVRF